MDTSIPPPGPIKIQGAAFAVGDTGYYGFGEDSTGYQIPNIFDKFYAGDSCPIDEGYNTITHFSLISLYPNPFKDRCYIRLLNSTLCKIKFSLFDIEGREFEVTPMPVSNDNVYQLNRGGLNNGLYILAIKYNDQMFYKKLIIIN